MRAYAHFDSEGVIEALVLVDAAPQVNAGLVPRPGNSVDQVDGVGLSIDELDVEAAIELVKTHKVGPASKTRKLVRR